jgi:hypothetical protein
LTPTPVLSYLGIIHQKGEATDLKLNLHEASHHTFIILQVELHSEWNLKTEPFHWIFLLPFHQTFLLPFFWIFWQLFSSIFQMSVHWTFWTSETMCT